MKRALWLWVVLSGCDPDPSVLYRCDHTDSGPVCQAGASCGADGYCHLLDSADAGS